VSETTASAVARLAMMNIGDRLSDGHAGDADVALAGRYARHAPHEFSNDCAADTTLKRGVSPHADAIRAISSAIDDAASALADRARQRSRAEPAWVGA